MSSVLDTIVWVLGVPMDHGFVMITLAIFGGLGALVAELVSDRGGMRVTRVGLEDRWSESAPNDFLLDKYGLSPARVAEQVVAALSPSAV